MLTPIDLFSNMGGVVDASFIYVDDLNQAYIIPNKHQLYLELNEGKSWTPLYMTINPEVNEDYDQDTELYSPFLKMRYPGITPELTFSNRMLLGKKLIVKVTTSNNYTIYIGTHEFPAMFSFNKLVGSNAASFSGYQAMFRSTQKTSMLFAVPEPESGS